MKAPLIMSVISSNFHASRPCMHVYHRSLPGLSCLQRLSGQFFALEDLGNLWRLEDGPELDSGWRLDRVGVHRIMHPMDDGAVDHRQAFGIKDCMRLRQLFLRHAHLVVVCVMRPKHCLAIRNKFKQYGYRHRSACARRLEVLFLEISDICLDSAFSGCHGALGRLGACCL
jgi:hypothetical protein